MPYVRCLLFAYYIYVYINKVLKFKIFCSILRCQTLKKNLPVPVILCWFQLPLLPTATLLSGQTGSCQRGHVAWPLCSFRETCSAKLTAEVPKHWTLAWREKKADVWCGNLESLLSMQVWLFWPLGSVLVRLNKNIYYTWKLFAEGVGEAKSKHY